MAQIRTHYDCLQIKQEASDEVIKGAYRYLSQKCHPDRNPNNREEAERITKEINHAYAVLSDPIKRKEHDEWIRSQEEETRGSDQAQPSPNSPPSAAPLPHGEEKAARKWALSAVLAMMIVVGLIMVSGKKAPVSDNEPPSTSQANASENAGVPESFEKIAQYTLLDEVLADGRHPVWIYYESKGNNVIRVTMPSLDICVVSQSSKSDVHILENQKYSHIAKDSDDWNMALEIWREAFDRYIVSGTPTFCG